MAEPHAQLTTLIFELEKLPGYRTRETEVHLSVGNGAIITARPVLTPKTAPDLEISELLGHAKDLQVRGTLNTKGSFAAWGLRWNGNIGRARRDVEIVFSKGEAKRVTVYSERFRDAAGLPKREEILDLAHDETDSELSIAELAEELLRERPETGNRPWTLVSADGDDFALPLSAKPSNRFERLIHARLVHCEEVIFAGVLAGGPFRWGRFFHRSVLASESAAVELRFSRGAFLELRPATSLDAPLPAIDEFALSLQRNNSYAADPRYLPLLYFELCSLTSDLGHAVSQFERLLRTGRGKKHELSSRFLTQQVFQRLCTYVLLRKGEHVVPEVLFSDTGVTFPDLFWPHNHATADCVVGDLAEEAAFVGARLRELADTALLPSPKVFHLSGSFRAPGVTYVTLGSLTPNGPLRSLTELLTALVAQPEDPARLLRFRRLIDSVLSVRLRLSAKGVWYNELTVDDFSASSMAPDTLLEDRMIKAFLSGKAHPQIDLEGETWALDLRSDRMVRKLDCLDTDVRELLIRYFPDVEEELSVKFFEQLWVDLRLSSQGIPNETFVAQLRELAALEPRKCRGVIEKVRQAAIIANVRG